MSNKMYSAGFVDLHIKNTENIEPNEHGLFHKANKEFYTSLLAVTDLLRIETLCRECHLIHEKILELELLIKNEYCQDYVATYFPIELIKQ